MRRIIAVLAILSTIASTGCAALLEGDRYSEKPFIITPYVNPPEERIEVSNYEELKAEMLRLVMEYIDYSRMYTNNYDGDIDADIGRAGDEIMDEHPIGAFIVDKIVGTATKIVTYYEVEIEFTYKRTQQQLDSIVYVATPRYLRTELLNAMSEYRDEVVFRTSMLITEDDIAAFVEEAYYQNPRRIVMLPLVAVETFPETGEDRIFEISLRYYDRADIMLKYSTILNSNIRRNTQRAVGDTDAEILLSLANNLIASTSFDEGAAQAISGYGAQNPVATAYGALENGNAVGEGFAMAYKALCDELEFDCRVVLGYLDGMVHAWNIVSLYGDYYHIDVAMGAVNGIETSFLKTDQSQMERYTWDLESTERCEGLLTYEDIVPPETPEEELNPDNPDALNDPGADGIPGGETGNGTDVPGADPEEPIQQPGEASGPLPPEDDGN